MRHLGKSLIPAVALCIQVLAAAPASAAGPYGDELSKCLVRSTTDADKSLLAQWLFAAVVLHPDVRWMATVSDAKRSELTKKTASLMERLLTDSCVSETRQALKYEGEGTLGESFNVLGQVAGRELFANPAVAGSMAELGKYIDADRLKKTLGSSR